MSAADEIRSILRDSGVPMTSGEIINLVSDACTPQSCYVFISDARKRGEIKTTLLDGKPHHELIDGSRQPAKAAPSKPKQKSSEITVSKTATERDVPAADPPVIPVNAVKRAASKTPTNDDYVPLAQLVGHTEAALTAYIESVVDPNIYGHLLRARDAAKRAYQLQQDHA